MLLKDTRGVELSRTDLLKKAIGATPPKVYDLTSKTNLKTDLKTNTAANDSGYQWNTKQATAEADRLIASAINLKVDRLSTDDGVSAARDVLDRALNCVRLQITMIQAQLNEPQPQGQSPSREMQWQNWRRSARSAHRHRLQVQQDLEMKVQSLNRAVKPKEEAMPSLVGKPGETPTTNVAPLNVEQRSEDTATFVKVAELILPAETYKKLWDVVRLMQDIRGKA